MAPLYLGDLPPASGQNSGSGARLPGLEGYASAVPLRRMGVCEGRLVTWSRKRRNGMPIRVRGKRGERDGVRRFVARSRGHLPPSRHSELEVALALAPNYLAATHLTTGDRAAAEAAYAQLRKLAPRSQEAASAAELLAAP